MLQAIPVGEVPGIATTRSCASRFLLAALCGSTHRGLRQVEAIWLRLVGACFFGKTLFKGLGLFETVTLHDTTSSWLCGS